MDPFDSAERLLAASLHGVAALVWAILAHGFSRSHGTVRPEGGSLWLFRILSGVLAAHYGFNAVVDLTSFSEGSASHLYWLACTLTQLTTIAVLPVLRHLIPLGTLGGKCPGRWWLAANYGSGVAVGVAMAPWWPAAWMPKPMLVLHVYLLVMTALVLVDLLRLARGSWRPLLMADLRFGGFLAMAVAVYAGVVAIVVTEQLGGNNQNLGWVLSHSFVGLVAAAPFALRILGEVVRRFLVTLVTLGLAFWIYFEVDTTTASWPDGEWVRLIDIAAVMALVVVLGPGRVWLRSAVDRFVLRQDRRWTQRFRSFLESLSPELGVEEICQRAAAEVTEGLNLAGAAIFLADRNRCLTHGKLDLEPVDEVWAGREEELPEGAFDLLWLRDPALQEALYEARVTWLVPIVSRQRRWGHLFVAAGPWGTAAGDAKVELLEAFMDQLALVLDVADLLARSLEVERELAQVEKLAAVGETAARIAHEIRNPVTAARSLAQMLAHEPDSPLNGEHAGLIVRELDRVERQVKLLLQFARDEGHRPRPLRLADLVRETMSDLEPSLAEAHLDVELGVTSDVTVDADPERLRQVVVNLVNNSVDALADAEPPKRLAVSVAASNGDAVLTVADSGPGVDRELLPRLFEPFVSRKPKGTGLGLAIAKRIVEAHGGRIEAEPGDPRGIAFRVHLPVSE